MRVLVGSSFSTWRRWAPQNDESLITFANRLAWITPLTNFFHADKQMKIVRRSCQYLPSRVDTTVFWIGQTNEHVHGQGKIVYAKISKGRSYFPRQDSKQHGQTTVSTTHGHGDVYAQAKCSGKTAKIMG